MALSHWDACGSILQGRSPPGLTPHQTGCPHPFCASHSMSIAFGTVEAPCKTSMFLDTLGVRTVQSQTVQDLCKTRQGFTFAGSLEPWPGESQIALPTPDGAFSSRPAGDRREWKEERVQRSRAGSVGCAGLQAKLHTVEVIIIINAWHLCNTS